MFSNNRELFDFIYLLIEKLNDAGEESWSKAFRNAMEISFMPGELLGEIWLTLIKLQKTDIPSKLGLERKVNAAIEALDKALKH